MKGYKNGREHEEEKIKTKMKRETEVRIKLKDELIDRLKKKERDLNWKKTIKNKIWTVSKRKKNKHEKRERRSEQNEGWWIIKEEMMMKTDRGKEKGRTKE